MSQSKLKLAALVIALVASASFHSTNAQNSFDAQRLARIEPLVLKAHRAGEFCGCVVAIGNSDGVSYQLVVGDRQTEPRQVVMTADTLFDVASLTKPIATATSIMLLFERGELRLSDPAAKYLSELDREATRSITIDQLLTHSAGYIPDNPMEDYLHGPEEAWRRLLQLDPDSPPGEKFIYSDVGFELLGRIVEEISDKPLDQYAREEIYQPLGMKETGYLPNEELRGRAVATEKIDGVWRVGEVHDPRSYALGGVAGHAGLFSTSADLVRFARMMLRGGILDGTRVLGERTVKEMHRPRNIQGNLRGAGWDMRSSYSSNRGDLFSDAAYGHGGFTGTGIWIDPELDLFVIFLSSRLHPDGKGSVNDLIGRIGVIAVSAQER